MGWSGREGLGPVVVTLARALAGRAAWYAKGGLCGKPTLAPAGRLVAAEAPRRLTSKTGIGSLQVDPKEHVVAAADLSGLKTHRSRVWWLRQVDIRL